MSGRRQLRAARRLTRGAAGHEDNGLSADPANRLSAPDPDRARRRRTLRQQAAAPDSRGCHRAHSRVSATFGGRLPIDVATMTDLDDHDDKSQVLNLVQDSVVPLSKAVSLLPRELFATRRPRIARQRRNLRDDPSALLLREGCDLLAGRRLDEKLIVCHDAGDPSRRPRSQDSAPWLCRQMRRDRLRLLRGYAGALCSPDRKQTSRSLQPSSGQPDGGRHRGRWLPAWSSLYGHYGVITSQRQDRSGTGSCRPTPRCTRRPLVQH